MPLLSSPQHEAYFFAHLENPFWITPLEERNIFKYPPKVEQVKGGGIRFPRWPPSRYLARMASTDPDEVAAIFSKMETDNPSIIRDVLHAALAMPADVSVSLVPLICRAAKEGTLWISFKDASDLCVRLAKSNKPDGAMELADALFTPTLKKGQKKPSRREEYWYKDGLKKVMPILAAVRARVFLTKLCEWLNASIKENKHVDPDSGSDFSYIWRPAIEEHNQNPDHDFAGVMVGFFREGLEQAIRGKYLSLDDALQIVDRYPYLVFKRIRLHLIGEFADQNPNLARQVMLDYGLFQDYEHKHEYAMLIRRRFTMLESIQQAEWLGWINNGPTGDVADSLEDPEDHDLSIRRRKYWRFEKLHLIRDYLTGEDQRFYQEMHGKHGEPEMADMNVHSGPTRWGHESPITVDELCKMTFEQAVDAISSWKSEKSQFMGPDINGLASMFGQYVATNPDLFSTNAQLLIDRPAIFVREFISQMSKAVRDACEVDLLAVLELCRWVLSRPVEERTTPDQEHEFQIDKNWQWTRDNISEFVQNVCKAKSGDEPRYPLDGLREPIWELIENLCPDRAESYIVYDISQQDPLVHDYLDIGINSPRGKAVLAALEYARWITNHIKQSNGKQEIVPGGFDTMPEIREMLQWQIAPENRSFEAMSVIGSQIPLINWIDRQWLTENVDLLFQLEGIEQTPSAAHGWAAWNAFLVWVRAHIEYYRIFRPQFAYAVEEAAKVELTQRTREQPMYHLGEHLMILYGRGQLGLDDDEGLLRRFVENSNPDVRRHAIGFVGQLLKRDEKVPEDVAERFMTLWEIYWTGSGRSDAEEKPNTFLFGMWFSCGQFPEQWALDALEHFVEIAPTPEPDHAIAEQLAKTAHVDIVKSTRILDRMVRGDREGWRIEGWQDSAKEVLRQALRTPGEAQGQAEALIDYLGRRGHTEFGQLLKDLGTTS